MSILLNPNGGNVGIGTTSPQTNLDVQGNGSDSQDLLRITRGGGNQSRVQIGHCYIQRYDGTGAPNALYINTNGGNVGIGPNCFPDKTLVVSNTLSGSASTVSVLTRFVNNGYGNTVMLDMTDAHSSDGVITFTANSNPTNALLGFGVDAVQKMVVDGNGNVGIGTTNPGYKLDVAGPIHCSEIITNSYDWADYVFKPAYKLASLSEVEGVIKREGHLPGMPSASDVAAHGLSVGEMQVKLLQKVEELTLHQIDEDKRLNEQSKDIEQLRKENAELRERLAK